MVDNFYKIKTIAKIVLSCLLFVMLGLGLIFVANDSDSPIILHITGLFSIVFFGGVLVYLLIDLIINPKKFWKKQIRRQKEVEAIPYLRNIIHQEEQDIKIIKLLKKEPSLGIPYFTSIILIVLFLIIELKNFYILDILQFGTFNIGIYFFTLSFICFSFYIVGYLTLGEMLQRKISVPKRSIFIDLILDYIYSIPFIIIISSVWVIFIFIKDKNNRNIPSSIITGLKRFSVYSLLIIFKYYTYINLAMITFKDKKTYSFKDSFNFFIKERAQILKIWFRSGIIVAIPFLVSAVLIMWNSKFHFIDKKIPIIIGGIFLLLYFLFGLLSEQISFLLYFISTRHKGQDINKLF
ncbi:MAG: hypothetical protein ACOCRK_03820 [bacterium]